MMRKDVPKRKHFWTKEDLVAAARQCQTRKEFERRFASAYVTARKRNLLDEICGHMRSVYLYRSPEEALEEAKQFRTLKEFRAHGNKAYAYFVRNNLLPELRATLSKPTTGLGNHAVYRLVWPSAVYIGLTCSAEARESYHLTRGTVAAYLAKTGLSLPPMEWLHENLSPEEAARLEQVEIRKARAAGEPLLNVSGGGQMGAFGRTRWTKEKVQAIALHYTTRSAFRLHARTAYQVAVDRGWREEVCAHMVSPYRHFTTVSLSKIAGQYLSRGKFFKADSSAYSAAKRLGCFEAICAHMIRLRKRKGG